MGFKKADLQKQALHAIQSYKLVFIEDVVSFLPCSKETFYNHRLHEVDAIKEAIELNKISLKVGLRKKMYEAEHPAAWAMLYKLVGSDEEADRLNGSRQKIEHSGKIEVDVTKLSDEELQRIVEGK